MTRRVSLSLCSPQKRCVILLCLLVWVFPATAEVILSNGPTACTITTSRYQLRVDAASPTLISLRGGGQPLLLGIAALSLTSDGRRYEWKGRPAPHLHTLRAGPHLVEFCLENIVLKTGADTWPGLAELRATCHEDKVYLHLRFLLPTGAWINAGHFVYRRPEGHPEAVQCSPSDARLVMRLATWPVRDHDALALNAQPSLAMFATLPRDTGLTAVGEREVALGVPVGDTPWVPGAVREAACVLLVAPDRKQATAALDLERHPLDASAFTATMGACEGFDPRTGLYQFRAQTSPTPEPPRGLRAGSAFSVANDARARMLLVDSFDPWGGICGGLVADGEGEPLPIRVQFGLNFPELHSEAGEPGWASLTFPLHLAPRERRDIRVEHLYGGATDHDLLYLNSLENVGGPLLYQATVSRLESFTVTSGGELAINDFRRHYRDLKIRSVSAILPTFFGYYDAQDRYQSLIPGEVRIIEAGPFLAEMTIAVRTADGRVAGNVRLWEVPCSDLTRLFSEVTLRVNQDVRLSPKRAAPIFFLRHHAFNPMAFRRFAAWVAPGEVRTGELNFVSEVAANGLSLASQAFGCLYRASNGIDQGIPCSDITGNPGWVLLDFSARVGKAAISPGLYAFGTGANDAEHGDYARDLAVVPARRVEILPAGSLIHYRALQVVYGDNSSGYAPMEAERQAWAVRPLRVKAQVGAVVSADPPHIKAANDTAEFMPSGGTDWIAVRVSGFRHAGPLRVWQIGSDGTEMPLSHARGEPWYISWPDAHGKIGYTFLVKLPPSGASLHLRATTSARSPHPDTARRD